MVTRCAFCGKKSEVDPVHKDYDKIRLNPKTIYICDYCNNKLRFDADESNKPRKPM
ncbi:MAG: DUF2197 domain-containing protein [Firmicutes bacterium]|nr:DUF2197 domain-containing protein [Bacillota bacterium]